MLIHCFILYSQLTKRIQINLLSLQQTTVYINKEKDTSTTHLHTKMKYSNKLATLQKFYIW